MDPAPQVDYAGFWRRAIAFYIDYGLVSVLVFPLVLLLGVWAPNHVVVSVPFGLFTEERVLSSEKNPENHPDGSVTAVETRMVEVKALGRWTYVYKETIERLAGKAEMTRQLVDPATGAPLWRTTAENLAVFLLLAYWVLMEALRDKGSFGKQVLGIRVVDARGRRPTLLRASLRNLSKLFSVLTLTIGFMMAGWTKRKQALHDLMADSYVIR